jgi:hypothetical protein
MNRRLTIVGLVSLAACSLVVAGCMQGPGRVHPPKISPSSAASAAMAKYDTNKDGFLDAKELEKAPSLRSALKQIDTNGDGKISADEIAARIAKWQESGLGLTTLTARVTLDGQPLEDATVTFVPEEFLGTDMQKAVGTTSKGGAANLSIEHPQRPGLRGVQPGLYRVEISKMVNGKETLPSKYNAETTLGVEVAQDSVSMIQGGAEFELKSE